jgi:hypothetical protein
VDVWTVLPTVVAFGGIPLIKVKQMPIGMIRGVKEMGRKLPPIHEKLPDL